MRYTALITEAFNGLRENIGLEFSFHAPKNARDTTDGAVTIHIGSKKKRFAIEVKREIRVANLQRLYEMASEHGALLVVAQDIAPLVKTALRRRGIAYAEPDGDAYLSADGIFIFIERRKNPKRRKEEQNRAFTKTGLKVLYMLLLDPQRISQPYRELAALAGTSLGNLTNVMNGLKAAGFLSKKRDGAPLLIGGKDLLHRWADAYGQRLKPTLSLGTFRFVRPDEFRQWKSLPLKPGHTFWGGEPAADLYTHHLQPGQLTLYTTESKTDLIKSYRLLPDPAGPLIAYKAFWQEPEGTLNPAAVSPLLTWADLMLTGDARAGETAEILYNRYLKNAFE